MTQLFADSSFFERAEKAKLDLSKGWMEINLKTQTLTLWGREERKADEDKHDLKLCSYLISSGKNGIGQREGSGQTPLGWHKIKSMIGQNAPLYTIFKSRLNTGKTWNPIDTTAQDLVLTRILLLDGAEKGYNRGKDTEGYCVDSLKRMIYIHGTPEEALIGQPASRGCIRMRNADLLVLFDRIEVGLPTLIHNEGDFHL